MSVNYAAGLSDYEHKGKCGQQEYIDTEDEVERKIDQLTEIIKNSKHCVVLTGAGISTSTGIPDFRGPRGLSSATKINLMYLSRAVSFLVSNCFEL